MKRLILLMVFLAASIQADAAKMSSYTENTTPNDDVYFIGVDPNDTTQTINGSNYRYPLSSILGSGLLNFNVNSLTVSGTGDSWFELKNNTSFTGSLTGKYGIRFYNGVLQQILNGSATNIGSASIQELASDPAYTDLDAGEMAVSTASGDLFIKTATGLYTIAGTYAADPTTPTLTSLTIPTSGDTATAVFSEAVSYGAGGAGGWTLNSPTNAMTYASGTGTDTIVFNLASTILSTDTPTVSYTQPTNGFESSDDGVDLASITNASVTNNSIQTSGVVTYFVGFNNANTTTMDLAKPTSSVSGTTETMWLKPITIPAGSTIKNIWVCYKTPDETVPYEVGVYTYDTLGDTGTRVAGASVTPLTNEWTKSNDLTGTTYFANDTTVYIETGWDGAAAANPGLARNSGGAEYYKSYSFGKDSISTFTSSAYTYGIILEYDL